MQFESICCGVKMSSKMVENDAPEPTIAPHMGVIGPVWIHSRRVGDGICLQIHGWAILGLFLSVMSMDGESLYCE